MAPPQGGSLEALGGPWEALGGPGRPYPPLPPIPLFWDPPLPPGYPKTRVVLRPPPTQDPHPGPPPRGRVPRTQGGYPGPTQGGYLGSPRRSSGRSARLIKSPTWGTPLRTRDDGFHPAPDWATHAVSASDPKGPNLVAMGTPKVVLGCLRPQDLRQGGRGLLVPTVGPPGPVLGLQRAFYPQELAFSGTPLGQNDQRLLDPSAFIPRCVFCSPTDYN